MQQKQTVTTALFALRSDYPTPILGQLLPDGLSILSSLKVSFG